MPKAIQLNVRAIRYLNDNPTNLTETQKDYVDIVEELKTKININFDMSEVKVELLDASDIPTPPQQSLPHTPIENSSVGGIH